MKRNASSIASKIYVKDGKIFTKEKCIIEFPKWYEDKDLASMQEVSYIYGIFAIIIGEEYSVSIIPTLVPTIPIMVTEIERDGVIYTQFIYGKDDCIVEDVKVVKEDLLSYNFFETYFMYAREPWYVEYEDLVRIMDNLVPYAKSNVGDNHISSELVVSFITRSKKNKTEFFRQSNDKEYEYVDLMNPRYSSLNNINKLGGNFLSESLVSAIMNKETKPSKLETLVR